MRDLINENKSTLLELEERLVHAREGLLSTLQEWYYYQNVVQPQILFDYERHFGDMETELHTKSKESDELERRTELLEQKHRRGEIINEYSLKIIDLIITKENLRKERQIFNREATSKNNSFNDFVSDSRGKFSPEVQNAYSDFRNYSCTEKNRQMNSNIFYQSNDGSSAEFYFTNGKPNSETSAKNYFSGINSFQNINTFQKAKGYIKNWQEIQEDMSIPHLYRSIVKKIHPDVNGESDNFRKYWHNVQDAYRSRNLNRLNLFYSALCKGNDMVFESIHDKEIHILQLVSELEMKLSDEKSRLNELKSAEPYSLADKLKDKLWISKRKRFLREKLFQTTFQIQIKQNKLKQLMGNLQV